MSDSEKYVFLTLGRVVWKLFWTFYRDRFLCQASDESHCKPGCSQVDVGQLGVVVVSNTTHAIFWVGRGAVRLCVAPLKTEQESTISTPNQYLSSEVNVIVRKTD